MSVQRRLRKLEGSVASLCPACGQHISQELYDVIAAEQAQLAAGAKEQLIQVVEDIAERQRLAQERIGEQLADDGRAGRSFESRAAHERATAGVEGPRDQVQEVVGADVRPDDGEGEDDYEQRVAERLNSDPVLDILRRRRVERKQARERARRAVKPTILNYGSEEEK